MSVYAMCVPSMSVCTHLFERSGKILKMQIIFHKPKTDMCFFSRGFTPWNNFATGEIALHFTGWKSPDQKVRDRLLQASWTLCQWNNGWGTSLLASYKACPVIKREWFPVRDTLKASGSCRKMSVLTPIHYCYGAGEQNRAKRVHEHH